MCSHYEALRQWENYIKYFHVTAPDPEQGKLDMWPRYTGYFIRKPPETDPHDEAVPEREALAGRWGLVPWRLKPTPDDIKKAMARSTFNARTEGIDKNFTFGPAWQRGQHCIIPVDAFYEPDWRTQRAVSTRFTRADGQPMGIAGLWDVWTEPGKPPLLSFTMLTMNATDHALLKNFHRPEDEKRIVVILPESRYESWLDAPAELSMDFIRQYPAENLVATPVPPKPPKAQKQVELI
ncbi:MAG: SOS response-associated peptidase family protein [Polaromonas sp.]|uniref:SOS response-associated peptidase n=1 Tax=Polaromonas sp. TaxID=1869339 RepID=UPI0025EE534B|nr:SOS response-associated peptidase family protein [Polaromonas sp.]MBI2724920.1 SOS response-associated peptidase family protein [Polaromonas sp.]